MLTIEEPFHGAVLNRRQGKEVDGGLQIEVTGEAPLRDKVTVNGGAARRAGRRFAADVALREQETDILATSEGSHGHFEQRVRVVWVKNSFPRYRFTIDDNSFFLRDITQKKYGSLFDCFYLNMLRGLHRKYGAKFVLKCYYTTGDDFSLLAFPDTYKGEWADNADWLRLSFHAYANLPDRPYQYASAQKLAGDFDLVAAEIHRFAGEQTWAPPTVIHWGMVQPHALRVLFERGVRVLTGAFRYPDGRFDVNYFLNDDRCDWLSRHEALKDFESGIIFSKGDVVCNNTPLDRIVPTLEPRIHDPNTAELMGLATHEQYFWPFYHNYIPDHAERCEAAIRFCTEHGYKPIFLHEGLLGASE